MNRLLRDRSFGHLVRGDKAVFWNDRMLLLEAAASDDDLHRLISHLHTAHVCSPPCARNILADQYAHHTTEITDD